MTPHLAVSCAVSTFLAWTASKIEKDFKHGLILGDLAEPIWLDDQLSQIIAFLLSC